jgi:DNA-binding NarL/FixJ family response regulator
MQAQPTDTPGTSRPPLRVAIADDHRLMLDGIKGALETTPDITVVGEATSGEEMLALVLRVHPDVVVLDVQMPRGDGLSTLARLRTGHPQVKLIILSAFADSEHIERALEQGAAGYVVKSIISNPVCSRPVGAPGSKEGREIHARAFAAPRALPSVETATLSTSFANPPSRSAADRGRCPAVLTWRSVCLSFRQLGDLEWCRCRPRTRLGG